MTFATSASCAGGRSFVRRLLHAVQRFEQEVREILARRLVQVPQPFDVSLVRRTPSGRFAADLLRERASLGDELVGFHPRARPDSVCVARRRRTDRLDLAFGARTKRSSITVSVCADVLRALLGDEQSGTDRVLALPETLQLGLEGRDRNGEILAGVLRWGCGFSAREPVQAPPESPASATARS